MTQPKNFRDQINIQSLCSSDWQAFKYLRLRALQLEPLAFSTSSFFEELNYNDEKWQDMLLEKSMFFAFINGKSVGMIGVKFENDPRFDHISTICSFFVEPEYRGLGIGKMLMDQVLKYIEKHKNILKIRLLVNAKQNAAVSLYEKVGFRKIALLENEFKIEDKFYSKLIMEREVI
jgi:ribosomal protein S18 acetylase RimI-like enzyme